MTTADLVDGGVEGIDAAPGHRVVLVPRRRQRRPPVVRAHRRGPFQPHLPGRRRRRVVAIALRRPPLSHVLPTAHDMAREYRVITALGPTAVPVPETFGLCEDPEVNGQPFYVMEFVDGHIIRDAGAAERDLDDAARRRAGESLADTLAALHAVDVDAVGLGDFAKRDGYIERQLRRWYEQFRNSRSRGSTPRPSWAPCTTGSRPSDPSPSGDVDRPRRLPARQHRARPRRGGARRARLGDLHPGRPPRRRRAPDGVLDRPR